MCSLCFVFWYGLKGLRAQTPIVPRRFTLSVTHLSYLQCCRFLRKRYKTLLQNRSGIVQFNLKTKPKSRFFVAQPSNANASYQLPAKDQSSKLRDDASPSTSAIIDLNEVSLPVTIVQAHDGSYFRN